MNKIWIDPDLLQNKSGIGRDSKFIIKWLESNFETEFIRFKGLSSIDNSLNRKILIAMRLVFGRLIHLNRKFEGAFYQSQLGPLLPGEKTNLWVVRLHDLFPVTNPEWFRWWASKIYKSSLNIAIDRNAIFLCDSKSTQEELLNLYGGSVIKSFVVPCQIQEFMATNCGKCDGCLQHQKLNLGNFYLSVGTIEPRKNYSFALSAWKNYLADNLALPYLVIVGRPGWKTKDLQHNLVKSINSRVVWLQDCCDGALEILYKDCLALISFSLAEGFDLPPMEARQKFQKPLILSDIPVHREFHSDVANFFSDATSLKESLDLLPKKSYFSEYSDDIETVLKAIEQQIKSILQKS